MLEQKIFKQKIDDLMPVEKEILLRNDMEERIHIYQKSYKTLYIFERLFLWLVKLQYKLNMKYQDNRLALKMYFDELETQGKCEFNEGIIYQSRWVTVIKSNNVIYVRPTDRRADREKLKDKNTIRLNK